MSQRERRLAARLQKCAQFALNLLGVCKEYGFVVQGIRDYIIEGIR